ncbi:metalloenzyme [Meiothermus sp. QL-1]|uniref:metalloenzyme n=1 Tax=Meiothermus sp. QL-1 TaxID=2058095 RepID=UPI00351552F5
MAFLFVDGLGVCEDPASPLHRLKLPTLRGLSRGFSRLPFTTSDHAYRVLDACLGVEGLPQSGTGQTTLLTGINAARLLGRHQGPHPLSRLQALLQSESLQVWAVRQGLRVLHANGYHESYLERTQKSRRNLLSAFGYAARAAGLALLPWEHPLALPPAFWPEPEASGARFARLAQAHHLVILEHWALDHAAHREPERLAERFLELDRFLAGFLAAQGEATLVLTSDHGNAEEPWHPQHTRNPVPLVVSGPLAASLPPMQSLAELAPWLRWALCGAGGRI